MISILKREQIEDKAWNQCVQSSVRPFVYATSWYLDIVCEQWEGIVVEGKQGEYSLVLPVPILIKWKKPFVRMPLFCQQLGVFPLAVCSPTIQNEAIEAFVKHYCYINPYVFAHKPLVTSFSKKLETATNYELALNSSYEENYQAYRRDRKKDLRIAKKVKQKIVSSSSPEPIIAMFESSVVPSFKGGIHPQTYHYLKDILRISLQKKIGELYYTQYEDGTYGAACFFVIWQKRIIYLFNAAYPEKRKHNGRMLILDNLIQQYSQSEYVLDFESPTNEASIRDFYQSFGAKEKELYILRQDNLPFYISMLRKIRKSILTR